MSSALTSTSSNSSYLYWGLIVGIGLTVTIWFNFQKPSVQEILYREAFKLNFTAFRSGILLSHYQFLASKQINLKLSDKWLAEIELSFNNKGFPVAAKDAIVQQEVPQSSQDCAIIWHSVLSGLKPQLALSDNTLDYWVEVNNEGVCIIRDRKLDKMEIRYQATDGSVVLMELEN